MPNGDVLIAESTQVATSPRTVFPYAMLATMRRAAALGVIRHPHHAGCATMTATASPKSAESSSRTTSQPFGMALLGETFYVGNTDGIVAFPYTANAERITAPGKLVATPQAYRPLDAQPAGKPRRQEDLCRRGLAHQHRREGHGGRARSRRGLRARPVATTARIFGAACASPSAWPGSQPPTPVNLVNERH